VRIRVRVKVRVRVRVRVEAYHMRVGLFLLASVDAVYGLGTSDAPLYGLLTESLNASG
jgi:hypothetical protein